MIFKAKISTIHVALNISCKAGSWRNAKNCVWLQDLLLQDMNVRHCKENAPIYMYYVAPETPMISSVIADCPDLAPLQYFGQVYAYARTFFFGLPSLSPQPYPCINFENPKLFFKFSRLFRYLCRWWILQKEGPITDPCGIHILTGL